MLLHKLNTCGFTNIDISIKSFWETFKVEILAKNKFAWNDEDLNGSTNGLWKSMSYYYFMYLLTLISYDIKITGKTWDYYVNKYNLINIKECLRCLGINFDKGLKAFGLPSLTCENGIECIEVEKTFEVEPVNLDVVEVQPINLNDLLATPNYCINYLNTCN